MYEIRVKVYLFIFHIDNHVWATFVEKTILSPLGVLGFLAEFSWMCMQRFNSHLLCSIVLFDYALSQCHVILITLAFNIVWNQDVWCLQLCCSFSGLFWLLDVFCSFIQILSFFFLSICMANKKNNFIVTPSVHFKIYFHFLPKWQT